MILYRKNPVVVEAIQFTGLASVNYMIDTWGYDFINHVFIDTENRTINISTLEGEMVASFGDYVIRGVKGEFYPCKPDVFDATYEVAGNN